MPRPTGRGLGVLGLAAGTYLAARVIGTWELYPFRFRLPGRVRSSRGCWWPLTGRRIRVTRSLVPERPVAGDEPEYTLTIKNASFLPGPQLTLRTLTEGLSEDDLEAESREHGAARPTDSQGPPGPRQPGGPLLARHRGGRRGPAGGRDGHSPGRRAADRDRLSSDRFSQILRATSGAGGSSKTGPDRRAS